MAVAPRVCVMSGFCCFMYIFTVVTGDAEVSCVFMKSCILPCSFQGGTDVILRWTNATGGTIVHSYYNNRDQLANQEQRFRGRTSLFKEQISRGNASLQLTEVEVQDQGRYKCYTRTDKPSSSYINLTVNANSFHSASEVDIQQVESKINSSSEGIYPEPEHTWSTRPPSNVTLQSPRFSTSVRDIIIGVFAVVIGAALVGLVIYRKKKRDRRRNRQPNNEGSQDIEHGNADEGEPQENCGASADKPLLNGRKVEEEGDSNGQEETQEMMETNL